MRGEHALIGHQWHGRASAQPCHAGKVPRRQRLLHQPYGELGQYWEAAQRRRLVPGLVGAHDYAAAAAPAHAEDILELAFLQRGNGGGADHAAVGDNADAADAKPRAQPVDNRQQRGHVSGIAGPQLGAQRPSVLVHDQPNNHLMEIRAVVFRVAAPAELLAALALEGQAGGIHEDDAELGKQVAPAGEQLFLHKILAAGRRQLAGSGLIRQRLAEPRHGAVEVL